MLLTTMGNEENAFQDAATIYGELGIVVLSNFFSKEYVAKLSEEADRVFDEFEIGRINPTHVAYRKNLDGRQVFERIDPICDKSRIIEEAATNKRLNELVKSLIGENPSLLKDKLIYKLPGDTGYRIHQDFPYYNLGGDFKDRITTVAIVIDEISPEVGGLEFFLRCHRAVLPAPQDEPRDVDPVSVKKYQSANLHALGGDIIAFHPLVPHASGPNRSSRCRRMLFFTYIQEDYRHLRDDYYEFRVRHLLS